ncbi:hypothetical protein [Limimaricola cinnabarinus]|uniref:hypothetical protein n=1 Tax=Limimaricola cinnabarinus TaxID=1125964 RepID=UPI00248F55BB|nr:hypothetical protein [Limimaricola cinnabarinus]
MTERLTDAMRFLRGLDDLPRGPKRRFSWRNRIAVRIAWIAVWIDPGVPIINGVSINRNGCAVVVPSRPGASECFIRISGDDHINPPQDD